MVRIARKAVLVGASLVGLTRTAGLYYWYAWQ